MDIISAHTHSALHRDAIMASEECGCFHCLAVFPASEITQWADDDQTAVCPRCWIDAVVGSASGVPLTREFLAEMSEYWFGSIPSSAPIIVQIP